MARFSKKGTAGGATLVAEAPGEDASVAAEPMVAAPPKLRRRPLVMLSGVLIVALGALLAVWAFVATSETIEVVAVREAVTRGETISAEDLVTVQITTDPALQTVPGADLQDYVGARAAQDVAGGSLLTPGVVTDEVVPENGRSVVGLELTPALMPGESLLVGDSVSIVATAGQQGDPGAVGDGLVFDAEVVGVIPAAELGTSVISVDVPADEAAEVARWAASGRVALVLESREG